LFYFPAVAPALSSEAGVFEILFEEEGYLPNRNVVMQGATLTRWLGHNGRNFVVDSFPGNGRPQNRALAVRLLGPGKRTALIQPSDQDFGQPYRRTQPHTTEFSLKLDKEWALGRQDNSGSIYPFVISTGGLAVQTLVSTNGLMALANWPGNLTVSLGSVRLEPEKSHLIRVFCDERREYRVEIEPGRQRAWSVRRGDQVEIRRFDGTTTNQPYLEARVYAALINPEWDCIPELRLETNIANQNRDGRAFLDNIRFAVQTR